MSEHNNYFSPAELRNLCQYLPDSDYGFKLLEKIQINPITNFWLKFF